MVKRSSPLGGIIEVEAIQELNLRTRQITKENAELTLYSRLQVFLNALKVLLSP